MVEIQRDNFVWKHLPPSDQLPEQLPVPGHHYSDQFNACDSLLDDWIEEGFGNRPALHGETATWTYRQLKERVCKYAAVLTEDLGVQPGNRVMLRGYNSPKFAALHLAVLKVGAVLVSTMPLLRARELKAIARKASVTHVICEESLLENFIQAWCSCQNIRQVLVYSTDKENITSDAFFDLDALAAKKPTDFPCYRGPATSSALIAFTSGTTGEPKGAVHTHKDLLAVCDTFAEHLLEPTSHDIFCCSAPLAFTYGLGASLLFPLRFGASVVLLPDLRPPQLISAISRFQATLCFTAPTAYRAILNMNFTTELNSLRAAVSAGETLPVDVYYQFLARTGLQLIDGIGSTEMLHIFISSSGNNIRPGATGKVVPGYKAKIVNAEGQELPNGEIGYLAVKGPTGCCYLDDQRQRTYVQHGWNVTGDAYSRDDDGYYWYQARMDDMIVSSGYKISPREVEEVLYSHHKVAECAVIGVRHSEKGQAIKAFVVLKPGNKTHRDDLILEIQKFMKNQIAPYKCPQLIEFVSALPKTSTGKLQRYQLRIATAA